MSNIRECDEKDFQTMVLDSDIPIFGQNGVVRAKCLHQYLKKCLTNLTKNYQ